MRNKNLVQTKLERVENKLRSLNFAIGTNSREDAYKILDSIKNYLDDVNTLLNTETQD